MHQHLLNHYVHKMLMLELIQQLYLNVFIYGEPTPHVIWERDGIELCEGDSLSDSTCKHQLYRLTLRHVQLSDCWKICM